MSKFLFPILSLTLVAHVASADVTVCNVKKVVKADDGSETVTNCQFRIDSEDRSGNVGSGGIDRTKPIGTASSTCKGFPGDSDKKGLQPYLMYDQGKRSNEDLDNLFGFITSLDYFKHGDIGVDPMQVSY